MGDLKRGLLGEVHPAEVAVMLLVFGRPRCFSFTRKSRSVNHLYLFAWINPEVPQHLD
jgi:hypothetical protein